MSRIEWIIKAKIAEQAQLFNNMYTAMKLVVEAGGTLSNDERNLLSLAYKHIVGARRLSWRIISSIEQNPETQNENKLNILRNYREKIEAEIEEKCLEVIGLLDSILLPAAPNIESQVFYNKMKGDYYRYMAEINSVPEKRKKIVSAANKAYNAGLKIATNSMAPVNPLLLGTTLNYSVFLYEIKCSNRKAINLAKTAFDEALAQVELLRQSEYKDSALIMQLLQDNLEIWTT
uniref:14-3-3 protein gamma-2-like n=1 Tax=Phallusia mammillata TaxID=59560 RepID=A0A6F9DXH6_9ASCI|nr:14-3-3 protein gamma-2-like [Phallusia mammillata]